MPLANARPDTAAQAADPDPLVMYLVVRRERVAPLDALISAAAQAVVAADRRFAADPAYAEITHHWREHSYRKVTLRASERDWAKLLERHEAAIVVDDAGEPLVAALPVRARSALCRTMRDLQAYNPDTSALPRRLPPVPAEPFLLLAANPHAPMSGGKLLAQVGHAALMAADAVGEIARGRLADRAGDQTDTQIGAWAAAIGDWERAGMPVLPAFIDLGTFRRLAAREDALLVVDSGLTEVAPGTETVLAVRPAAGETAAGLLREIAR